MVLHSDTCTPVCMPSVPHCQYMPGWKCMLMPAMLQCHHMAVWACLFVCLLCPRTYSVVTCLFMHLLCPPGHTSLHACYVPESRHGHTSLPTFCVSVLAVPMAAMSQGHQVGGSEMLVHAHAMVLLCSWEDLFGCLLCPRDASWWLGHGCSHVYYVVVLHYGGLAMPGHMPSLSQGCKLVNCLHACLHTLSVSALPIVVYVPTLSQCHTRQCWHVCLHVCHALVLPLGNLGMPVCILVVFQFYAWQNCLHACCVPVSPHGGLDTLVRMCALS